MMVRFPCDQETLRAWLLRYITAVLDLPDEAVAADQRFDTFGFDSVEAVIMAGVMEEEFGVPVDPIQLLEHPSINAFAKAFASDAEAPAGEVGGAP